MKKILLIAAMAASLAGCESGYYPVGSYGNYGGYGGLWGPTGNATNRWSEATDPGYCLSRNYAACKAAIRGGYYASYAGIPIYAGGGGYYAVVNSVKVNTWRRGGRWYKNCGNDPAVPVEQPCYEHRTAYPAGYAPSQQSGGFARR